MYQKTITIPSSPSVAAKSHRVAVISTVIAILLIKGGITGFRVDGDVTAAKGRADGNDYLSLHLRFPGAMCSN